MRKVLSIDELIDELRKFDDEKLYPYVVGLIEKLKIAVDPSPMIANITKDYASRIAEKQETIASLNAEIASITANIDTLKADLKEKKTALKKAEKEVASLEAKKVKADAKATEEAKKAEAESVVKRLLASGMSADEILEKLK